MTDLLTLLEELQSIARTGLNYSTDPYARAHYSRLLELAAMHYGQALDMPAAEVRARLQGELGSITPKVGADAAIFDDEGRILLVERSDDRCWGLPAGWVDPNEAPWNTVRREAREELALEIEPVQLVDVMFRPASAQYGPHAVVSVVYLSEVRAGEIAPSHEVLAARYWAIDQVPVWHKDHRKFAEAAHAVWTTRRATL
ncbi:MAG TPA: NUDIX hydrolase N-terminal domain-containing protein [Gemmatimonadaceae bacterium]|nr:NUDIX hydrolase N-terminal domain-containing protein [Gemmatimonadaceae bacterium]